MNPHSLRRINGVMSSYKKPGIEYRKKQVQRLINIFEDIFEHEGSVAEDILRVGRKHIIGYWRRTENETAVVRQEKFRILQYFFEMANTKVRVPPPKKIE
ncbi:hypothetical protein [Vibrio sp. B1Z05]|uniref:hypothetical protein n=1 Tax=Vibrio sp. B1Z05 TaxID=2654980 RepID=UPI00128D9FD8|nr:hypothetical protein [Vibrio sp. B1Z05]MPW37314.1 hypothetical protein [Vibrio sp. B1Z05]